MEAKLANEILTDTRGSLLRGPGGVRLAEPFLFAHQFVARRTVVGYPTAERVTLPGMITVGRIRRLATGTSYRKRGGVYKSSHDLLD